MEDRSQLESLQLLKILRPFQKKAPKRAWIHCWTAILPFFFFFALSFVVYDINKWLTFLIMPFTAAFIARLLVVVHDCGHRSFSSQKKWNDLIGNICGFLSLIPYTMWVEVHNNHHRVQGNLDKRNKNPEIATLTLEEYQKGSLLKRIGYRLLRSKYVLLFFSGISYLLIFRIPHPFCNLRSRFFIVVYDLLYAAILIVAVQFAPLSKILFIVLPPYILFLTFAAFIFYAQHQYEDAYWAKDEDWSFLEAGVKGSSYLKLPQPFQWITGNVGIHHVHHLNPLIPNYNLVAAHEAVKDHISVKTVTFPEIWRLLDFKVWDNKAKKLTGFPAPSQ